MFCWSVRVCGNNRNVFDMCVIDYFGVTSCVWLVVSSNKLFMTNGSAEHLSSLFKKSFESMQGNHHPSFPKRGPWDLLSVSKTCGLCKIFEEQRKMAFLLLPTENQPFYFWSPALANRSVPSILLYPLAIWGWYKLAYQHRFLGWSSYGDAISFLVMLALGTIVGAGNNSTPAMAQLRWQNYWQSESLRFV